MPKWTNEKRAVALQETILALTKAGGKVAEGKFTGRWFVNNVPTFANSHSNIGQILKLMDRDGHIVVEKSPGGYIIAVSLPEKESGNKDEAPAEMTERGKRILEGTEPKIDIGLTDEKPPSIPLPKVTVKQPPPTLVPLDNLSSRVDLIDERANALIREAEDVRRAIAMLQAPPAELDVTAPLKEQIRELEQKLRDTKRKAEDREKEAVEATRRLKGVNDKLTVANGEITSVKQAMARILTVRSRGGSTIRELLTDTELKKVNQIIKRA